MKKKLGTVEKTNRGFEVIRFKDRYGVSCSIQQSSLAEYEQPGSSAIWLGVDDLAPRIMARDAARHGIVTDQTTGWIPFPVHQDVLMNNRMHLSRSEVKQLIPILEQWLKTGSFKK